MSGMKSWSVTPANNVLANTGFTMDEGQAPSTLNDSIRQAMADIRTEWAQGANIASATTTDLSAATGGYVHITGTTTITGFGTISAGIRRKITFDGALTLTHNAASLILPTGGNITTVAGDTCEAMSEGSGNWRVLWYAGKNVQATIVTATTSVVTPLVIINSAADASNIKPRITLYSDPSNWSYLSYGADTSATFVVGKTGSNFTLRIGTTSANDGTGTFTTGGVQAISVDTGTTGSGALKTNAGTTVLTWANDLSVKPAGLLDLTTATAGQVGFPAAQNASAGANVLDDYEEGTWTPSVGGSATYTLQTGTYTKIGRLVFIRGDITINAIGTGSTTTISGLPFAAATATICQVDASLSVTAIVSAFGSITTGSTIILSSRTAASASSAINAIFQNGTTVNVGGCYQV